jgi:hypothetical protein
LPAPNRGLHSPHANTFALAPPEYVILRKLEYHREGGLENHLRDIRAMIAVSGEQLDRTALQDWMSRLDLNDEWRQVTGGSRD